MLFVFHFDEFLESNFDFWIPSAKSVWIVAFHIKMHWMRLAKIFWRKLTYYTNKICQKTCEWKNIEKLGHVHFLLPGLEKWKITILESKNLSKSYFDPKFEIYAKNTSRVQDFIWKLVFVADEFTRTKS